MTSRRIMAWCPVAVGADRGICGAAVPPGRRESRAAIVPVPVGVPESGVAGGCRWRWRGLAVFRARIIAVGRFAVRGQAAGNRRAAAVGTRVLARGLITGAIGRLLGAGATLCRTIARAAVLTAILASALVAVRCFVCVALLLLFLLLAELLQKVLQRIAVMPCTLVCRVQGQGMFIGFQCSGIVTGHGQSGAAIEKIFRVVRLYMAERCPLLGGGSMLTGLIERPGTPFGIAEALRGGRRLLVLQ